jgi:uncharacterized protein
MSKKRNGEITLKSCHPQVRAALAAYIQQIETEFAGEVLSVFLYGSQARGEASDESDIDLLVVIHHDSPGLHQALTDLAWEVQFEHDVVISDIIRTERQMAEMQAAGFPYYRSIEREAVLLWQTPFVSTPVSVSSVTAKKL